MRAIALVLVGLNSLNNPDRDGKLPHLFIVQVKGDRKFTRLRDAFAVGLKLLLYLRRPHFVQQRNHARTYSLLIGCKVNGIMALQGGTGICCIPVTHGITTTMAKSLRCPENGQKYSA